MFATITVLSVSIVCILFLWIEHSSVITRIKRKTIAFCRNQTKTLKFFCKESKSSENTSPMKAASVFNERYRAWWKCFKKKLDATKLWLRELRHRFCCQHAPCLSFTGLSWSIAVRFHSITKDSRACAKLDSFPNET